MEQLLLPYRKGNLWGFCTKDKTIVIPCEYDQTLRFQGDTAIVKRDGKYGAINRSGKLYVPIQYPSLWQAHKEIYQFEYGDPPEYDPKDYEPDPEVLARISPEKKEEYIEICRICKLAAMEEEQDEGNDGSGGYCHEEGYVGEWCGVKFKFQGDKFRALDQTISTEFYDNLSDFWDGLIWVLKDGKFGAIDPAGKQIIPIMYDNLEPFGDEEEYDKEGFIYTYVELNDQWGLINNRTNEQFWED